MIVFSLILVKEISIIDTDYMKLYKYDETK